MTLEKIKNARIAAHSHLSARPPPSILIILMGALGDIARGLCLVSHIKTHRPGSSVSWLVEPKWKELVCLHPLIDNIIVFKRSWRFSALRDLYQDLSRHHFDITLDLQRILKSGFFAWLSGAKRRIGFHRRNAKEFNWLFNNDHITYHSDELSKLNHYLKFTEHLGLPEPVCLDFGFSKLDVGQTAPMVISQLRLPFIAVVMGSSWQSKDWHFEGYRQLIQRILSTGKLQAVLLGDQSQIMAAKHLTEQTKVPGLLNLVGQTSLPELIAVLKSAAAGVGPDSGPGHLAAAVGTPFVALFGPTAPVRTAPYGSEDLAVNTAVSCAPCYKDQCPGLDRRCMKTLNADAVVAKLSKALARRGMDAIR